MSREGAITPLRKPATVIAAISSGAGRRQGRDGEHDRGIDGEAGGGDLAVAPGAVGEEAAGQHADGAGAEIGGQRDVGGRRTSAP